MYKLNYLPAARQDLIDIVIYISRELGNRTAAELLAEEFNDAGNRITQFPYANPAYTPIRPLKHEYRKCIVQHYIMFYWVNEETKTATIARVIYAKRDLEQFFD